MTPEEARAKATEIRDRYKIADEDWEVVEQVLGPKGARDHIKELTRQKDDLETQLGSVQHRTRRAKQFREAFGGRKLSDAPPAVRDGWLALEFENPLAPSAEETKAFADGYSVPPGARGYSLHGKPKEREWIP